MFSLYIIYILFNINLSIIIYSGEDADEETDLSENPYAVTTNEELYIDDPKKELKKWFEREGEELTLETEQAERGKMVCRIT